MRNTFRMPAGAVLLGLLLAAPGAFGGESGPASLPAFDLPDLDGKSWSSSEFAGKVVVLDFWASWCTTCKESVPKLAELQDRYRQRGLVVIGVSVDKGSKEKVRKAVKRLGMNYLVLWDREGAFADRLKFSGLPSLYVFDRRGEVQLAVPGYDPQKKIGMVSAVEKALNTMPQPVAGLTEADQQNAAGSRGAPEGAAKAKTP